MADRFAAYPCPECGISIPPSALIYVQHGAWWDLPVSHCPQCQKAVSGPPLVQPVTREDTDG